MSANIKNNEDEKMKNHLEEQFQQMVPREAPPDDLKEEVFNTLSSITLFADVLDLFTVKFTQSEAKFLEGLGESDGDQ